MQQLEEAANTAQRNGADEGKRILRRDPCITSWIFLEGDDGESIFEQACKMGLEGIVSKRRDFPIEVVGQKSWMKIKNSGSAAVMRIQDGTW